jgi:hypothetical protein
MIAASDTVVDERRGGASFERNAQLIRICQGCR